MTTVHSLVFVVRPAAALEVDPPVTDFLCFDSPLSVDCSLQLCIHLATIASSPPPSPNTFASSRCAWSTARNIAAVDRVRTSRFKKSSQLLIKYI